MKAGFLLALAMSGVAAFPSSAAAQDTLSYAQIDAQYFDARPAEALAAAERLLLRDPTEFELLWRISRIAVALGMLAERQNPDHPMYLRAEGVARTAARLRPDRVEGHYWLSAAVGRRALFADMRTTAKLGNEAMEAAKRVLAIDSTHAGAHDVVGKIHSEVRKHPAVTRFIAGRILGIGLAKTTSWELAERHLLRAVALDSTMLLYRLDLAEFYVRRGRPSDAMRQWNEIQSLRPIHPFDAKLQGEARALMAAQRDR